jgi:hypothetical protein
MRDYLHRARGPYKYSVLPERLTQFLFDYFDKLTERLQRVLQDDHNRTKVFLQQSRESEERLRRNIKEYDA